MILIVGATGQLGTAVIRRLQDSHKEIRAFVRQTSDYQRLQDDSTELAFGDLRDKESVDAACNGVEVVIATANTTVPRTGRYSFEADEGQGYLNLIESSDRNNVRQFIFMSLPVSEVDPQIPELRFKRLNEQRLQESRVPYTILRGSLLMDMWLALIGSNIPLRGAEAATLHRSFWFARLFMRLVGGMIENRGVAVINGDGKARHAFLAIDDAAAFLVNTIDHPDAHNAIIEIGGPDIMSWDDAVATFAEVLGRPVRATYSPPGVFRFMLKVLMPFSPAVANVMGLNWWSGICDSPYDSLEAAERFGVTLTSMEQFLRGKLSLPVD
ncbi:MAG: NmrA family NAD(P)-binding protein [Anaerolineales bacterium]|nr:NmrA family NAD(P)-binding protein [Anaerolineales bacterium]